MFSRLNKVINSDLTVHRKAHKFVAVQQLMYYGAIHYPFYITNRPPSISLAQPRVSP